MSRNRAHTKIEFDALTGEITLNGEPVPTHSKLYKDLRSQIGWDDNIGAWVSHPDAHVARRGHKLSIRNAFSF